LREGGLVEGQRHGYYVFYRFVPAGLAKFSQQLDNFLQM
jgi:hypothetical protein